MERIFKLQNLNCANCASVIEAKLNQLESVSAATFTLGTQQLRITSSIEDTDMLRDQIQAVCDATEDGVVVVPFVRAPKKAQQVEDDHEHNSSLAGIIRRYRDSGSRVYKLDARAIPDSIINCNLCCTRLAHCMVSD